jgi:RimJ/RimL family protein N-acetyltransferase
MTAWVGEKVRLRGMKEADKEVFCKIESNYEDMRMAWRLRPPRGSGYYDSWLREESAETAQPDEFRLVVADRETDDAAGWVRTTKVDYINGTFSYGMVIGEDFQGNGLGFEAATLLLSYMFGERRLNKCDVALSPTNTGSRRLNERLGFVEEGCRRNSRYTKSGFEDILLLGVTRDEFFAKLAERSTASALTGT